MKKKKAKSLVKKTWHFIWEDDSLLSWIVNVVLAFIIIKFLVYPGLGLIFGTSHPVVAVVSGSMEHKMVAPCVNTLAPESDICVGYAKDNYQICGKSFQEKQRVNFDSFWDICGEFYRSYNINKLQFEKFSFRNGFNTGDIIVLFGRDPEKINVGDVIVFVGNKPDPIIHRVIKRWEQGGKYYFTTKGDHNGDILPTETTISEDRLIGRAVFKIPLLGYIKIWFVEILKLFRLNFILRLFS